MPRSRHLLAVSSCALLLFPLWQLSAQTVPPLQAELIQRLDLLRIKVGDPILAKSQLTWDNGACYLRAGSIIQGRVVTRKEHSKTEKTSEIGIAFESGQCDGREMKPLFLTVAAVVGPSRDSDQSTEEMQPLTSAIGVMINGNVRSVSQTANRVWYEPRQVKNPDTLKPGQVVGVPHLALAVGQGDGGASILFSAGHDVRIDRGTTFVLVPNLNAEAASANANRAETPASTNESSSGVLDRTSSDVAPPVGTAGHVSPEIAPAEPPPSDLENETEVCVAPDCSIANAGALADDGNRGAQVTLPLKGMGYVPPGANREMASFDYDASIAYLGPSQFLFTFNPHTLVPRRGSEATTFRKLRLIRAMLIDLQKNAVMKTLEWRIPDSGRYLWPVGRDRVLVHTGEELRVYGTGLKLHDQIFLGGQLAFVRISPSSEFFAVGIIHERHTHEIHRSLELAEQREPEEDLEVRLFDSQFKVVTTVMRSSRTAPPILLDEGEVHIHSLNRQRWQLVETSWAGQRRVLATAVSTCAPEGDSLPGDVLFLTGCDRKTGDKWYRILHSDGKVVLKGWSPSSEMAQTAGGNVADHAFAIRIAQTTTSRVPDGVFTPSDLKGARVTIYNAKNGRRIFSVGFPDPIPAMQTFAISPQEDQLAILTAREISFYRFSQN
jgi:hypothetical protein